MLCSADDRARALSQRCPAGHSLRRCIKSFSLLPDDNVGALVCECGAAFHESAAAATGALTTVCPLCGDTARTRPLL